MDQINREHPEYTARRVLLRSYGDLYAGGEQFRARAQEYLVRRHREGRRYIPSACSVFFTRTMPARSWTGTLRR